MAGSLVHVSKLSKLLFICEYLYNCLKNNVVIKFLYFVFTLKTLALSVVDFNKMAILPLLRQFMVGFSPQLAAFSMGGSVAFPTVLLHQLKANDSTVQLDMDTASWIGSIYGISGIPAILMPMIMQWRGRKTSFILTCCVIAIGWVISYSSTTASGILAGESFHGFGTNSLFQVSFMGMSEMIAPKYRLFAMQLFGVFQGLGMAVTGIGGRFLHYKTISLIMLVPAAAAVLVAFTWPESPPWLACKGEFDRCERAFVWLRGTDEKSTRELTELIAAQKENLAENMYRETLTLKSFWQSVTSRDFYMPSLHVFLLMNMLYGSGGDVVLIYFLEMVDKTAKDENATFYSAVSLYTIVICGCIVTNVLHKYFNNKTTLLSSTFGVICCLLSISISTYLQSINILPKESYLVMYLLLAFMVCNALGLNAFVFFISAELIPVKYRNIGGAFLIICNCCLYAFTLKVAPYLMHYIDMWGTFTIFTVNGIVCWFLTWKYVPETKGRTLQEIEDYYKHGKFIKRRIDKDIDVAIVT